jgi:hypothetical protein
VVNTLKRRQSLVRAGKAVSPCRREHGTASTKAVIIERNEHDVPTPWYFGHEMTTTVHMLGNEARLHRNTARREYESQDQLPTMLA